MQIFKKTSFTIHVINCHSYLVSPQLFPFFKGGNNFPDMVLRAVFLLLSPFASSSSCAWNCGGNFDETNNKWDLETTKAHMPHVNDAASEWLTSRMSNPDCQPIINRWPGQSLYLILFISTSQLTKLYCVLQSKCCRRSAVIFQQQLKLCMYRFKRLRASWRIRNFICLRSWLRLYPIILLSWHGDLLSPGWKAQLNKELSWADSWHKSAYSPPPITRQFTHAD